MNEIIKGLYEIEEQAGQILESAKMCRQELLEEKRRKIEDSAIEMEKELEGRLTILRSQLEEQTEGEINRIREENQMQMTQMHQIYEEKLNQFAQEILEKITEV